MSTTPTVYELQLAGQYRLEANRCFQKAKEGKGNSEFMRAEHFYTESLKLHKNAVTYANRAQLYLELMRWARKPGTFCICGYKNSVRDGGRPYKKSSTRKNWPFWLKNDHFWSPAILIGVARENLHWIFGHIIKENRIFSPNFFPFSPPPDFFFFFEKSLHLWIRKIVTFLNSIMSKVHKLSKFV